MIETRLVPSASPTVSKPRVRDVRREPRTPEALRSAVAAVDLTARRQATRLRRRTNRVVCRSRSAAPVGFILGSGRSGTTLFGELVGLSPEVNYLFEPTARWADVSQDTDVWDLWGHDGRAILGADSVTSETARRFKIFFNSQAHEVVVDKSPENTLRLGFLDALCPDARYIHVVRDGTEVAQSIARLASHVELRHWRHAQRNLWWGVSNAKLKYLLRDAAFAGYWPEEQAALCSQEALGAYEWLVSVSEVRRWKPRLQGRLLEIRYCDLLADPIGVSAAAGEFLGIPWSDRLGAQAQAIVEQPRNQAHRSLELPPRIAETFNATQREYGFSGRAVITA